MFKIVKDGILPSIGSKHSAAVDLYSRFDIVIQPGETERIKLGVSIDLQYLHDNVDVWCGHPYKIIFSENSSDTMDVHASDMHMKNFRWYMDHHFIQLMIRSSLGDKGLIIPNGIGVIDMDYKDEIEILIHNPVRTSNTAPGHINNEHEYEIQKGDRVAQAMLVEHKTHLFGISTKTQRSGGFGSTGEK